MSLRLVIWDDEGASPEYLDGHLVLWRSYGLENYPNAISIPELIEENADAIRSRYLAWVHEIGETRIRGKRLIDHLEIRPGFSFWWMTLIAEKCNWDTSPYIVDAIRLYALEDWVNQRSISEIKLISSNGPLVECLKIWCVSSGIAFTWQVIPVPVERTSWLKRVYRLLPKTLQSLVWLIKHLVENWSLKGAGLDEWRRSKGQVTFISYLVNLVPAAAKAGYFESRYWTKLPPALFDKGAKTNWLHVYIKDELLPTSKQAAKSIRQFNDNSEGFQTHVTLSSFLSFGVVIQTFKDWFLLRKEVKGIESELRRLEVTRYLWPLFSEDWRSSIYGHAAMSNLLMFRLFESALNQLPRQKKGVYLQENQGWEFGFIQAWKSGGHQDLIGFPHASVRFWDLRYHRDPRSYERTASCRIPLPDRIACNGKAALEEYRSGGYWADNLLEVESLRHLYLYDLITSRKTSIQKSERLLLVIGDFVAVNTHKQLQLLERAAALLFEEVSITFKPHPSCPVDPKLYPQLSMTISTKPPDVLMKQCDVVFSSMMTSAAVDAYYAGLPVIIFEDGADLNLSPLRGCDGVSFVSSPEKLAGFVNNFPTEDRKVGRSKDYFFNIDPRLPMWRQLLLNNANV